MEGQAPQLWTPDYPRLTPALRQVLALPPIDPAGPELARLTDYIRAALGRILGTSGAILILPSTVQAARAALVQACPGGRVLHFVTGPDSEAWSRSSAAANKELLRIRIPEGKAVEGPGAAQVFKQAGELDVLALNHVEAATGALSPLREITPLLLPAHRPRVLLDASGSVLTCEIQMDRDGIDGLVAGSLGFGIPPGLCVIALGPELLQAIADDPKPSGLAAMAKTERLLPADEPPCLPLVMALGAALRTAEETHLAELYHRQWQLAARARAFAKEHFALASEDGYTAYGFTCIKTAKAPAILAAARQRGFILGPGQGAMAAESFRLGHRPDVSLEELDAILDEILAIADAG